jgi:hypothetical protein
LTKYTVADKFEFSIATTTPTARQRRSTLGLAAVVLIATGIITPFAAIQLQRIDGFIPTAESAIIIGYFFTTKIMSAQAITAANAHEIRQPLTRITAGGGAAQRFLKMVPPQLDKAQNCS